MLAASQVSAPSLPGLLPGGRFVVSLDFELHWGVADLLQVDQYRANLLGVRQVVPELLRLFHDNGIRATWATVGMLLARTKRELLEAAPPERPTYARAQYSNYSTLASVGEDEETDPFHFGPALVAQVVKTPGQELATHTFSHYYCLEAGQQPSQFRSDLQAALALSQRKFGVAVRSIVFPRNQFAAEHLRICGELGLRAFRGNPRHWLYHPRAHSDEQPLRRAGRLLDAYVPLCQTGAGLDRPLRDVALVDVMGNRFLRPVSTRLWPLEPLRVRRIIAEMDEAVRAGRVYHLWWHPHNFGVNLAENLSFLGEIIAHYRGLNRAFGMQSANMSDVADEVLGAA